MWDSLLYGMDCKIGAVIEFKTTKRAEDWSKGAPDYYALQASLYAYLLGVKSVIMVASFLEEPDYDHPENFVPSSDNTIIDEFLISERFPQFQAHIERATEWWNTYVLKGISPEFDEKKDADILKNLRTNKAPVDEDVGALIAEADKLKIEIDGMSDKVKRLKELGNLIKEKCIQKFRPGDKKVSIQGATYDWVLTKGETTEIDKEALKADGLLEKYSATKTSYKLEPKLIKEEK
jgi:hypothetical protein